jgi:hypothetical protein
LVVVIFAQDYGWRGAVKINQIRMRASDRANSDEFIRRKMLKVVKTLKVSLGFSLLNTSIFAFGLKGEKYPVSSESIEKSFRLGHSICTHIIPRVWFQMEIL